MIWNMRQLPPLAAVRVFEAAARQLNFTRAAAELGMTQAAVSYQIRLLEERLGTLLFHRDKGRVSLTEAGRRASPLVSNAFDALGEAFAAARNEAGSVLTISAANTIAANWLAPRLGGFQLRHPGLAVRLESSNTLVDFARDDVDVAVRLAIEPGADVERQQLFVSEFAPMASPDFLARNTLATPSDLLDVARISPDDDWWRVWFAAAGIAADDVRGRRGSLLLDSQVIEGASAIAGSGVALLNLRLWAPDLAAGRLVMPFPITASSGASFWLVYPPARRNVVKIRQFREWILAESARV
jgi:LysR family glycine cleavage system transcriptional activator